MDGSKETPPSNVDPKVKKKHQRNIKNTMSIINLNLAKNQFVYIKSWKGPMKVWKTLCNIHKTKKIVQHHFCSLQFFHVQDVRKRRFVGPCKQG